MRFRHRSWCRELAEHRFSVQAFLVRSSFAAKSAVVERSFDRLVRDNTGIGIEAGACGDGSLHKSQPKSGIAMWNHQQPPTKKPPTTHVAEGRISRITAKPAATSNRYQSVSNGREQPQTGDLAQPSAEGVGGVRLRTLVDLVQTDGHHRKLHPGDDLGDLHPLRDGGRARKLSRNREPFANGKDGPYEPESAA